MRRHALLTVLNLLDCSACLGQAPESYSPEFKRALRHGAEAKVTVKVTDELGNPVTNANIKVFFRMSSGKSDGERIRGTTDDNGVFTAEGRTTDTVFIGVEKSGCYISRAQYNAQSLDPARLKNGRWLPWNPTILVVLREIRNPVPMYVKIFDGELTNGATYGFDCMAGDFVEPHGRGNEADFMITCKGVGIPGAQSTHSIEMVVPDPAGGFITRGIHSGSAFKSDHLAPEQGYSTNVFAQMEYDSQRGVSGSPFALFAYFAVKKTPSVRAHSRSFASIGGSDSPRLCASVPPCETTICLRQRRLSYRQSSRQSWGTINH